MYMYLGEYGFIGNAAAENVIGPINCPMTWFIYQLSIIALREPQVNKQI